MELKSHHNITLDEAAQLTSKYRAVYSGSETKIAEYFDKTSLEQLLNQPNCVGARFYYGLDTTGTFTLVIAGVDASGNDIYEGVLLDNGIKCPSNCSATNPLNS